MSEHLYMTVCSKQTNKKKKGNLVGRNEQLNFLKAADDSLAQNLPYEELKAGIGRVGSQI